MRLWIFSTTCIWTSFHPGGSQRDININLFTYSLNGAQYSHPILNKIEFLLQAITKIPNIKFHENRGQTDRHDEANSRFSQVWKGA